MKRTIITSEKDCPIKPSDIDTGKHFWGAFGNSETEVSANYIVRLCLQKGGWFPFTREEIEELYQRFGYKDFWFNRLTEEKFIILNADNKYYVTKEFVTRCYEASSIKVENGEKIKGGKEEIELVSSDT